MFWPFVLMILVSIEFCALNELRSADAWRSFYFALTVAIVGIAILFLARLPLYRQRKFLTFGPRLLDARHRKLYWTAYFFIGISVLSLVRLLIGLR